MIEVDVVQRSPEWLQARCGMPTASAADRILTPKTLKLSAQAGKYRNQLLAERILGRPLETGSTAWMARGVELEEEAIAYYELQRDVEVRRCGLVLRPDGKFGGSPDGLVGDEGGLEVKCPSAGVHVGYLLNDDLGYVSQVQSYLYLTGRRWWDTLSFCPGFPPVIIRVERDEGFIEALEKAIGWFLEDLEAAWERLVAMGVRPAPPPEPLPVEAPEGWGPQASWDEHRRRVG